MNLDDITDRESCSETELSPLEDTSRTNGLPNQKPTKRGYMKIRSKDTPNQTTVYLDAAQLAPKLQASVGQGPKDDHVIQATHGLLHISAEVVEAAQEFISPEQECEQTDEPAKKKRITEYPNKIEGQSQEDSQLCSVGAPRFKQFLNRTEQMQGIIIQKLQIMEEHLKREMLYDRNLGIGIVTLIEGLLKGDSELCSACAPRFNQFLNRMEQMQDITLQELQIMKEHLKGEMFYDPNPGIGKVAEIAPKEM